MQGKIRPGYKQTEVGVIPEDWDCSQLDDFLSFISYGFTNPMPTVRSGVIMVTAADVSGGRINYDTARNTSKEAFDKFLSPKSKPKKGDILLTKDGALGRVALVGDETICINQSVAILRPNNRADPQFLSLLLQADPYQRRMIEDAGGSTIKHIYITIVNRMPVAAPLSKDEQRAIAAALSDADALIAALEAMIAKKRDLKQAAMQHLLTGKTRLPGFSGEWEVKRLGEVANFFKGKGLPKSALSVAGKFPCIHYGELFTFYGVTIAEVASRTDQREGAFLSVQNDVLMPTSDVTPRGLAKASCLLADDVILGGDTLVIRPNEMRLDGSFLAAQIRFRDEQVLQLVTGSTVFHLYASDMRKFVLPVPAIAEQSAIAEVLSDMDADLAALYAQAAKARAVKQGMMQELLTGKVRLV
jgi:type I restriction enzyme S subunit